MGLVIFVAYVLVGAVLCGLLYYLCNDVRSINDKDALWLSVCTGTLFPVVAPFSFSIILVKRMLENRK